MTQATIIYVDADACPVKDEVYRVAGRYGLAVKVVANGGLAVPADPLIERVLVAAGPDVADDWIAERAGPADIVITADIPLASRCVKAGAEVLAPTGKRFTPDSIGLTLASRDLMTHLRDTGVISGGGPRAMKATDRSAFLSALDNAVVRLRKKLK